MPFGTPKLWGILGGGVAAIALVTGVFFFAKDIGQDQANLVHSRAEVVQLEEDLAEQKRITESLLVFQEETEAVSNRVSSDVIEKTNTITEVRYVNQPVIEEVFRDTPFLSEGWVYAHDAMSKGEEVDPIKASDRTPSNFTEADSLRVIGNNYAKAFTTTAQVEGWIDFYDGVRAANERVQPTDRTDEGDSSSSASTRSTGSSDTRAGTAGTD